MSTELLKKLIESDGPSGSEGDIREIIKKEIRPFVDELYTDRFGNLIGRKKGKGANLMLVAHMDEVGVMVSHVDKDGKVFLSPIGGIEALAFLGERVRVVNDAGEEIPGVTTTKEIQDSEEIQNVPTIKDIYVDTGFNKKELEDRGIRPGNYVYIMKNFMELADGKLISGKALDDRVGCLILLELAKKCRNSKADIYFVFTVQEEIGLYGAKTSLYSLDPDYAIAVDVVEADDGNLSDSRKCVDKGPVLIMKDAEMITSKFVNDLIFDIAKKQGISIQPDVSDFGTTDALNISVSKGGTPCTVLGVVVRNIHTTTSVASKQDIKETIKLLEELLKDPPRMKL
jgi:tetrahedral aminopeptidase